MTQAQKRLVAAFTTLLATIISGIFCTEFGQVTVLTRRR